MPLMTHSEDDKPHRGREAAQKRKRLLEEAPMNTYMRFTGMRDIPSGSRQFLDSVKDNRRRPETDLSPILRDKAAITPAPSSRGPSWDEDLDVPEHKPYADLFVQPYLSSSGILKRDERAAERQRQPDPPALVTKRHDDSPLSDRSASRHAWSSDTSVPASRDHPSSPDTPRDASRPTYIITLDNPRNLDRWTRQTEFMARSLGCHDQLFDNSIVATINRTEEEWITNNRIGMAYNLVHSRLSPAVFAYMRVLGYSRIMGKSASNLYHFAKLAASRLKFVQSGQQRDEEVQRMYEEWRKMDSKEYHGHNPIFIDEARTWLHKMLVYRAETGDTVVKRLLESAYQSPARDNTAGVTPAASSHHRSALRFGLEKDEPDGSSRKRQRPISPASSLDLKTDPEGRPYS